MKKVKHIFAFVALLAILFHSGAYTAVFLNFQFNKSFIASNLCENRFSPELKCEGKCYLKKQMTQQEEQNQGSGLLSVQQGLDWVYETETTIAPITFQEPKQAPAAYFLSLFTQHNATPRPHPPCMVS